MTTPATTRRLPSCYALEPSAIDEIAAAAGRATDGAAVQAVLDAALSTLSASCAPIEPGRTDVSAVVEVVARAAAIVDVTLVDVVLAHPFALAALAENPALGPGPALDLLFEALRAGASDGRQHGGGPDGWVLWTNWSLGHKWAWKALERRGLLDLQHPVLATLVPSLSQGTGSAGDGGSDRAKDLVRSVLANPTLSTAHILMLAQAWAIRPPAAAIDLAMHPQANADAWVTLLKGALPLWMAERLFTIPRVARAPEVHVVVMSSEFRKKCGAKPAARCAREMTPETFGALVRPLLRRPSAGLLDILKAAPAKQLAALSAQDLAPLLRANDAEIRQAGLCALAYVSPAEA